MIENTILKRCRAGQRAAVFGLTFPSSELVELAARAGFDALFLDGEHGAFSPADVNLLCRVANGYGLSVIARVPNSAPETVNLWLDRGVQGIIAPHVETADEAQRLADACRFPPEGRRSWGGGRGTAFNDDQLLAAYGGRPGFMAWANANLLVFAQIESKRGYEELDAILGVPGLSGVTGGPNDLAASLGYPGQPGHPEVARLAREVEARARAAGKLVLSDLVAMLGVQELVLGAGREFVARQRPGAAG